VAAANPCRRGCPSLDRCLCTPAERNRYLGRLSRPLLDRIDLQVELPALEAGEFQTVSQGDGSAAIRARVVAARERQRARLGVNGPALNTQMSPRQLRRLCPLAPEAARLLGAAMSRLGLSARGHDRALRVARTIADLAGADTLRAEHCAEAVQYRSLDRSWRA
jgi:magnesium chelatase family protein